MMHGSGSDAPRVLTDFERSGSASLELETLQLDYLIHDKTDEYMYTCVGCQLAKS
jgi:hypothetical protein